MDYYHDQGCDDTELLDWLFDQNNGGEKLEWLFDQSAGNLGHQAAGHHGNHHTWTPQEPNVLQQSAPTDGDFLSALLTGGGDSVSGSPLWSPSPSDSGISEDPASDQMDSPQRPDSPSGDAQCFGPKSEAALGAGGCTDLHDWECAFPVTRTRDAEYQADAHRPQPPSGFPLTVKDLLLSGTPEHVPHPAKQSMQELILNEDEKKLLAKEGVTLPSQLPLTKYEERILKKIRRKIRNKQSAQESRKKKKEYIDGLESRMSTCNAHNQELQRKVSQLEKRNMSLMEQLRRLQALIMNTSNRPAQTGTCVLVLLLSFSLILFPSLKPLSDNEVSQGDFSPVRIQSRTLQNFQDSHALHVSDPLFSAVDEAEPAEWELDDITAQIGKLELNQDRSTSQSVPQNSSQEDRMGNFHIDPITGHIATVTLDPRGTANMRPHADGM
ncbi:cyclic AMP-responsive element-binding protein 3-like protein 3-A [Nelusetta ayraudi]|uniref:cyclic AMP-responsive element-binding protein 3-like protein 3-A n=1 Tax=Nelusetta ayraudi TaxID=303726 RepID=UPI003F71BA71